MGMRAIRLIVATISSVAMIIFFFLAIDDFQSGEIFHLFSFELQRWILSSFSALGSGALAILFYPHRN